MCAHRMDHEDDVQCRVRVWPWPEYSLLVCRLKTRLHSTCQTSRDETAVKRQMEKSHNPRNGGLHAQATKSESPVNLGIELERSILEEVQVPSTETSSNTSPRTFSAKFGGGVSCVVYSSNGDEIAIGCLDGVAIVFDVSEARGFENVKFKTPVHDKPNIRSVALSPDGRFLATGCDDHKVRVFDIQSGQLNISPIEHPGLIFSVSFSPDGLFLASGCSDKCARIFEVSSGKVTMNSGENGGWIRAVCFSPDGELLVTGSEDKFARIYAATTGREALKIEHAGLILGTCFSPDGLSIATASSDGYARIFDVETKCQTFETTQYPTWVRTVAFCPDGTVFAIGCNDHSVYIVDLYTGNELMKLSHSGQIWGLSFCPKGMLLSAGDESGNLREYDIFSSRQLSIAVGMKIYMRVACLSQNSEYMAIGNEDGYAQVFSTKSGAELFRTTRQKNRVVCVAFSPDNSLLAISSDAEMGTRIYEIHSGIEKLAFGDPQGSILCVRFSSSGKYTAAAGSGTKIARIHDVVSGLLQFETDAHGHNVQCICWSPSDSWFATACEDKFVRVFDAQTGSEKVRIEHPSWVQSVAYSPGPWLQD